MQTTRLPIPIIRAKVFICYAQADKELHRRLEDHLIPLRYSGKIDIREAEIPADADWSNQTNPFLQEANVVLLLISSSFIASRYCWNREVGAAIEQDKTGLMRIIPIILRPVNWKSTPLGRLNALPKGARPVIEWNNQDAALKDAVQGIEAAVDNLLRKLEEEAKKAEEEALRKETEYKKEIQREEKIKNLTRDLEERLIPTYERAEENLKNIEDKILQQEKRRQGLEIELQEINALLKDAKSKERDADKNLSELSLIVLQSYNQLIDLGVNPRHFSEKCLAIYQSVQQKISGRSLPKKRA